MNVLKVAVAGLGGLFLLVTLIGFAFPRTMRVERSANVSAPPSAIYPLIANVKDGQPLRG